MKEHVVLSTKRSENCYSLSQNKTSSKTNAIEILCAGKRNILVSTSFSPNIGSSIIDLASNSKLQLTITVQDFEKHSNTLDDSTSITGTTYCAVFIREVGKKFNVTNGLQDLLSFEGGSDRAGYI